jgi:hypothetical protein
MPTERFAMRHVHDVIRLKSAGMPTREIARRLGTAPSTVRLTIRRFEAAGLSWPLPDGVTDTELEARLFASAGAGPGTRRGHRRQTEPDWAAVHRELRRKHATLSILWEEYIAGEPGGYRYSRFCELYRAWESRLSVTMRQSHAAGDKLFVDYAGDGVPVVIDRLPGERRTAQIFVAVLGASSFTYAQATWTQGSPTGSAATSAPSRRSAACRHCLCRTTPVTDFHHLSPAGLPGAPRLNGWPMRPPFQRFAETLAGSCA